MKTLSKDRKLGKKRPRCPDCGKKFAFSPETVYYETLPTTDGELFRTLNLRCKSCSWECAWQVDDEGNLVKSKATVDEFSPLGQLVQVLTPNYRVQELQARIADLERRVITGAPHEVRALGKKTSDFTRYFDEGDLTEKQREVASLKFEYGLTLGDIAKRLRKHHSTVQYLLARAATKINHAVSNKKKTDKRDWDT